MKIILWAILIVASGIIAYMFLVQINLVPPDPCNTETGSNDITRLCAWYKSHKPTLE